MMRSKATGVVIAGAVIAVSCSGVAAASTRAYNGPAGPGPNAGVEFGAHVRKGHARSVFRFEFHNIPARCGSTGTTAATSELGKTMKVRKHRRFATTVTLN